LESGHIVASGTPHEVLPILGQHGIYLPEGAAVEDLTWLKR
ncbi:MAG: ABC transporter ATP-binding protein, partial [Spirochaetales bacterium]|nr:ABC transporter ATP-binding protein [Spirochaetales bacterium]